MNIIVKGDYKQIGGKYVFENDKIIIKRAPSYIEIKNKAVSIYTDILGIDKLYYCYDGKNLIFSNKLSDFSFAPIDKALWPLQIHNGFIPYPFTVLKNVRKSLPAIEMTLKIDSDKLVDSYSSKYIDEFYFSRENRNKKDLRSLLFETAKDIQSNYGTRLVSLFSAGFDSSLLTYLLKDGITAICHYTDNATESNKTMSLFKKYFPAITWHIYYENGLVSHDDIEEYFNALNEPCFDEAGLPEFLLLKSFLADKQRSPYYFIEGYGADGIFGNGRQYLKEWLLGLFFNNKRTGIQLNRYIRLHPDSLVNKTIGSFKDSKSRFFDIYTRQYKLQRQYEQEILKVYKLYEQALRRLERANFFAAISVMLYYSNHAMEKLKTIARGLNTSITVPFLNYEIMRFAISIDARYKVGYVLGKRILREAFPEVENMPYVSRRFSVNKFLDTIIGGHGKYDMDKYMKLYAETWLKINNKDC